MTLSGLRSGFGLASHIFGAAALFAQDAEISVIDLCDREGLGPTASFFSGVSIRLGTILGRFSIIYFRGSGLRIRVRGWG